LCSRDPTELDEPLIVAATLESLAENASDSGIAPLLYFCIGGVPGAVFYRAVNTLDAMIGYHGRYEYFGKASARLDDLLNWVPARLTALLLLLAGLVLGRDTRQGWRILRRDARKTESPNAGRPMATVAGLLRVELEKRGHYRLGDGFEPLTPSKIRHAWQLVVLAFFFGAVLFIAGIAWVR
jgi:adenosylcobinamide-phosphate synthase